LSEPNANPRFRPFRVLLIVLLTIVLISAVAGVVVWRVTRNAVENIVDRAITPKEQTIDLSTLVTQVRELSRLETSSMQVMHISTTTQTYEMIPDALAGDQLTFLAAGDVIAGVDLSLLNRSDVWKTADGTLMMRLPPSQILVTRVDNRRSRVISRKTGLLRKADIDLESRVRQHAEQEIRNEAIRRGVLRMASNNAETKLADFLHTLGFQQVRFVSGATSLQDRQSPSQPQ
jgi:hypothetical protein